jgi:uncharacterized protein (DUF983 family)
MIDPRTPPWKNAAVAYRVAGVVFLVAGVIFVFTSNNAMWISMFTIGIVFLTLSMTLGRPSESTDSTGEDADPGAEPPAN